MRCDVSTPNAGRGSPIALHDLLFGDGTHTQDDLTPAGEGTCPGDRCYSKPALEPDRLGAFGPSSLSPDDLTFEDQVCEVSPTHDAIEEAYDSPVVSVNSQVHVPSPCRPQDRTKKDRHNPEFGLPKMMSYPRWCASLLPHVLRSRTPFAAFISMTVQLSRRMTGRGPPTPTLFPIPLPHADFGRMPAGVSSARRRRIHLARTVHLVCMALNFWHAGGVFASEEALQRSPNRQHITLYERVKALIKSDGSSEMFEISQTGRKFPNLLARLSELSAWLTLHGVSSNPYDKSFSGIEVPPDNSASPELQPYSDLDPSRLVLHGEAQWNVQEHLPDDLLMAFLEPRSILIPEGAVDRPLIRDTEETIAALALKWDSQGLLVVHNRPVDPKAFVRIFNARKSADQDRQIGDRDRRGANGQEAKVVGPSSTLPAGADLCELYCNPKSSRLRISITDRKDFYHQISISKEKSWRNTLAPSVPISSIEATSAYAKFCVNKGRKYNRLAQGDRLGSFDAVGSPPPEGRLWVSFGSVLQGDHLGVEVATAAHTSLLQSYGLLGDDVSLRAHRLP